MSVRPAQAWEISAAAHRAILLHKTVVGPSGPAPEDRACVRDLSACFAHALSSTPDHPGAFTAGRPSTKPRHVKTDLSTNYTDYTAVKETESPSTNFTNYTNSRNADQTELSFRFVKFVQFVDTFLLDVFCPCNPWTRFLDLLYPCNPWTASLDNVAGPGYSTVMVAGTIHLDGSLGAAGCVPRHALFGRDQWVRRLTKTLGLDSTLRAPGRPRKKGRNGS